MPGESPRCIEVYSSANCPSDMNVPMATTACHDARGRGTRNTAGRTTAVNRIARKSSGGTSCIPHWITTELKPQIVATNVARRA